ncbi:hypothetical protein HZ994_12590 [Akkermansiaceae bacterium]|nr:hypothetical protein HZ994_12590 [Akkermansiaceae bacterium]
MTLISVTGFLWSSQFSGIHTNYPRLSLPAASNTGHRHATTVVSLSSDGTWIHGDAGVMSVRDLGNLLTKESAMINDLGRTANISVRIPADAPARHFLAIYRIAVESGYDRMGFGVVRPRVP